MAVEYMDSPTGYIGLGETVGLGTITPQRKKRVRKGDRAIYPIAPTGVESYEDPSFASQQGFVPQQGFQQAYSAVPNVFERYAGLPGGARAGGFPGGDFPEVVFGPPRIQPIDVTEDNDNLDEELRRQTLDIDVSDYAKDVITYQHQQPPVSKDSFFRGTMENIVNVGNELFDLVGKSQDREDFTNLLTNEFLRSQVGTPTTTPSAETLQTDVLPPSVRSAEEAAAREAREAAAGAAGSTFTQEESKARNLKVGEVSSIPQSAQRSLAGINQQLTRSINLGAEDQAIRNAVTQERLEEAGLPTGRFGIGDLEVASQRAFDQLPTVGPSVPQGVPPAVSPIPDSIISTPGEAEPPTITGHTLGSATEMESFIPDLQSFFGKDGGQISFMGMRR